MLDNELDIGPLSWVKGELDLALERAESFLQADTGAKEIREARSCLHQCQGALTIVGLDGVTCFTTAIENLLADLQEQRVDWDDTVQEAALTAIVTLRSYLDGLMAGAPDQPLALYPVYRQLVLARGLPAPSPAALFFPDLNQRPPRREWEPEPLSPEALTARLKAARLGFDRGRQKWLKGVAAGGGGDPTGLRDMRNSVAIIEQTRSTPTDRAFWWICVACFDGLKDDIADPDLTGLLGRLFDAIDQRIQALVAGDTSVPDELLREVLYQVAIADGAGADSDTVKVVRAAYRLAEFIPREAADGKREQARQQRLQQLAQQVAMAQEEWDRFCSGSAAALPPFHEACLRLADLAGDSGEGSLGRPDVTRLASAIGNAANQLRKNPLLHGEALAEEVVTALLLLEGVSEELARPGGSTGVDFPAQVDVVVQRLGAILRGDTPTESSVPSLATPQLLTLSRRARDKRLLAQVCREMKVNLEQVEQALDAAFRNPDHPELLESVPLLLKQVEGALTIIEQGEAARLIADIMAGMARLSYPGRTPVRVQERDQAASAVAERLSALNAYIDGLALGRANPALLDGLPTETAPATVTALIDTRTLVLPRGVAADMPAATEVPPPKEVPPPPAEVVATVAPAVVAETASVSVEEELLAIFLEEAREVLAELDRVLPELKVAPDDPVSLRVVRRGFHTLKGSSRMVGLTALGETAWAVEQKLNAWLAAGIPVTPLLFAHLTDARDLFGQWVQALSECSAPPDGEALARAFDALSVTASEAEAVATEAAEPASVVPPVLVPDPLPPELESAIDPQLLPLFLEESEEGVSAVAEQLRFWRADPADSAAPASIVRLLHTLKGSARMVGALGIGDMIHRLETRVTDLARPDEAAIDELADSFDRIVALIDELRGPHQEVAAETPVAVAEENDTGTTAALGNVGQLRIRSERVDQLINEAGEIAIARSRIEAELKGFKAALEDLTENVSRLRHQLRDIEIQAETQMASRHAHVTETAADFDPLEMDRFTRFQELTRMMAESVNDVSTVQHSLLRGLAHVDTTLTAQARLNRDLSQGLLRVRMVPFSAVSERLHRVVRQTAKELGKLASLVIEGETTEVDRSVLERLVAPLEHLLRNALAHGIETPAERLRKGKPESGAVTITVAQQGNEIAVTLADDGAGLDLARIRQRGMAAGLLKADGAVDDAVVTQLIFQPGFTTATELSAVAGRGVGMDVVRNEVVSLGGRIEVHSETDRGCRFQLSLPVTLAIGQALLVRLDNGPGEESDAAGRCIGIPAGMVEQAVEVPAEEMAILRQEGSVLWNGRHYHWHYLPRLLGQTEARPASRRRYWRVMLRGGARPIALEVDAVLGNQEVVMKPLGPQLERVPGIAGATVLGDGEIALIINPVLLAERQVTPVASTNVATAAPQAAAVPTTPTIMVVDDSLTVRKITGRLLERAGYRVLTAKDGVDALEKLYEQTSQLPRVMLADIEMPRMDGFELVRSLRGDERFKQLPVIMITSRTADKHRSYAAELGVDHFLGKPYDEDGLLALIRDYLGTP